MIVAILVPVLARPHRVVPLMESVAAATEDYRLLFVASENDHAELAAFERAGADYICVGSAAEHGQYARKINAAYRQTTEPLLFLGADDLHFHPGWFSEATAKLGGRVEVVGTNDLGNDRVMRGTHSTHSLVTRRYIDERGTVDSPGEVLHQGYFHNFVDDEFIATAKLRGAFAFAPMSHVEHLHPLWKKGETDETYRRGLSRFDRDRRIFIRRQRQWGFVRG